MSTSSTSNSDAAPYGFFLRGVAFAVLAMLAAQAFRLIGLGYPAIPAPTRPGDELYIAWDGYNHDHVRYLFEEGGPRAEAARAQLLLLGNSRLMFGFDYPTLRAGTEGEVGLIHFMGFGQADGQALPALLLQKEAFHPRLALVNADRTTFRREPSRFTRSLLARDPAAVLQEAAERRSRNARWRAFMTVFPVPQLQRFNFTLEHTRLPTMYRSLRHGDWVVAAPQVVFGRAWSEVPPAPGENLPPAAELEDMQRIAREFADVLRARGARVVFTVVPNPDHNDTVGRLLAEAAGVEFVTVPWTGYQVFDASHLAPSSTKRFTEALLPELRRTKAWQEAFGAPPHPGLH